jgi:hypothetical protein
VELILLRNINIPEGWLYSVSPKRFVWGPKRRKQTPPQVGLRIPKLFSIFKLKPNPKKAPQKLGPKKSKSLTGGLMQQS